MRIAEESQYMTEELKKWIGVPFNLADLLHMASANIIGQTVYGTRHPYYSACCSLNVAHNSDQYMVLQRLVETFPFLGWFPLLLPGYTEACRSRNMTRKFAKQIYDEHVRTMIDTSCRDYVDSMLLEKTKTSSIDSFTEHHIRESVVSLFLAGSDTTRATLSWAFLLCVLHPRMQTRIQQEIDEYVGVRSSTMKDFERMHFTQAFLTECQRFRPPVSLTLPHLTSTPVDIGGYHIPTGTVVYANLLSVLHDGDLFGPHPELFNPERFLKDNHFVKPKKFIIFGLGRRKCPGETMGRVSAPLFFISVLQNFHLSSAQPLDHRCLEGEQYGVYMPSPYKVMLEYRNINNCS